MEFHGFFERHHSDIIYDLPKDNKFGLLQLWLCFFHFPWLFSRENLWNWQGKYLLKLFFPICYDLLFSHNLIFYNT